MTSYLIKLGEISLKGLNRHEFEKKLCSNIRSKLKLALPNYSFNIYVAGGKGRIYLDFNENLDKDSILILEEILRTSFGLVGFSNCNICEKTKEALTEAIEKILLNSNFKDDSSSYMIDARREDKSFFSSTREIECYAAEIVSKKFPSLRVDLSNPKYILYIEVRKNIYLYSNGNLNSAFGGLPVGISGKGLSLLSGGIDSPVSSILMARRGLHLELCYFHAYPYTSDDAKEKVKALAKIISKYLQGTILHIVSFTEIENLIEKSVLERDKTIILRAAMIRVATILAKLRRCKTIVTGESLGQVASQTIDGINFTDSMTDMLVLRPLIAFDKEEITNRARLFGTYETSILPYSDCCSLFSPDHPNLKPIREKETKEYFNMENIRELELKAVEKREEVFFEEW